MKRMPILGLLALAALLAAVPLAAQNGGTLKDVSFTQENGKTVILIKVDGQFTYETSSLTMPRRLVIDLTPVDKITAQPYLQVNESGVVSVRAGQFNSQTARLVFDLNDQNSAQTIAVAADGLRVTFWLEGEAAVVKEPVPAQPVREIPQEEVKKITGEPSVNRDRLNFFVRASTGLNLFLKPDLTVSRDFSLYGETGSVDETYSLKTGLALDVSFGKYFSLGSSRMKAGIGLSYWTLPSEGTFSMSLPHPFLMNTPRTVAFTETSALKTQMVSFYAYALFSFVDTDNLSVFFGPLAGFCSGKYLTLSNWDLTEKSPFASADVTVTNPTYFEDTVSELIFGASLNMELSLGQSFALVLDIKMLYINPKITNLGVRANLLHIQPALGVQYSF
jgi:hypothetical protein